MPPNTANPHPHVITGRCPVPCHPHGILADVAGQHRAGTAGDIRGIGLQAAGQISQVLSEAGLIS